MHLVSIFWRVVALVIGSGPARSGGLACDDLITKLEGRNLQWSLSANCNSLAGQRAPIRRLLNNIRTSLISMALNNWHNFFITRAENKAGNKYAAVYSAAWAQAKRMMPRSPCSPTTQAQLSSPSMLPTTLSSYTAFETLVGRSFIPLIISGR